MAQCHYVDHAVVLPVCASEKSGRPSTSAHRESTITQINRRVPGSEKYWSEPGTEDLLPLTADHLSTSQPLTEFWQTRSDYQTGLRSDA